VIDRKLAKQLNLESRVYLWRARYPAPIFGIVLLCGLILGTDCQVLNGLNLDMAFFLKSPSFLQSALPCSAQSWIEQQAVTVALLRGSCTLSGFERYARAMLWQSLGFFFLGICEMSVVVPTLNEEEYVSKCLKSLREQDFGGNFEVIVVDGGSSDSTTDLANALADKVIVYKNKPVGDARNLGAKLAETEMVAFIDADTIASKGWLDSIRESLSFTGVVGVTGPTLPYAGSPLDLLAYKVATGWLQRFSMVFGLPHVAGFNCAYRRGPFLRCGGFEEGRTLSEDLALSLKIRYEGQLIFNKKMIAYTSTRRARTYGYGRLAMFYLMNDAIFALTGKSLYYPPVR